MCTVLYRTSTTGDMVSFGRRFKLAVKAGIRILIRIAPYPLYQ